MSRISHENIISMDFSPSNHIIVGASHPNNIHGNLIQHFFLTLSGTNKKHILNVNFKKQSNHYKVTQNEVQSAGVRSRKKGN